MPILHTATELAVHPWILLDISDHRVILYDPEGVLLREVEAVRSRLEELPDLRHLRVNGSNVLYGV
jgi:hypothetical protein